MWSVHELIVAPAASLAPRFLPIPAADHQFGGIQQGFRAVVIIGDGGAHRVHGPLSRGRGGAFQDVPEVGHQHRAAVARAIRSPAC